MIPHAFNSQNNHAERNFMIDEHTHAFEALLIMTKIWKY